MRARTRWYKAVEASCRMCPAHGSLPYLTQHHIVYSQEIRRLRGDLWDPRNALTLCERCHARHHQRVAPIPLKALPDCAYEFAVELMGRGRAYEYFRRRYVGYDPRLDALIKTGGQ